ncbi:hypothetical protein GRX03_00260 [Halovenus sp. WSH3]|uniref:DUF8173 domain-containing protein n=1 Tax=Halovenus carboxidivorans TaxID=2692199 RepID=A0A6B0T3J4_9EURY|nr:hypothetical protein [Halovenus carboxidivorans]MXR50043.1 hypothetical protein [Halovenus carboxidivorans]
MERHSPRRPALVSCGLVCASVFVEPASAEVGGAADPSFVLHERPLLTVVTIFVIGTALVLVSPEYTEDVTDTILEEPGSSFGAGLLGLFSLFGLAVILVLSRIGVVLLVPIAFGIVVVGVIGYLTAGRVVGETWPAALAVATVLGGLFSVIPVLGTIGGLVVLTLGLGGVIVHWQRGGGREGGAGRSGGGEVRMPGS